MSQRPSRRSAAATSRTRSAEVADDGGHEERRYEPRYDAKELRDAARILAPFLGLIKDTNNPYARLVGREVCKTFYRVLHPDARPADVLRTVRRDAMYERSRQVWTEFWLYVPGARVRDWTSLRTARADGVADPGGRGPADRAGSSGPADDACPNILDVSPPAAMYDRDVMSTGPRQRRSRADRGERPVAGGSGCRSADRSSARRRGKKPTSLPPLPLPRTPVEPERRTNALDRSDDVDDGADDDDADSADSQDGAGIVARDAHKMAEAFAGMASARRPPQEKRDDVGARAVHVSPPTRPRRVFDDDDEWNDNVFNDADFVRLLPFYELAHNQIEYVATEQQQYSLNMLDDIMPVLYHIHYELGDPRLKNDMLVEHVNLITRNTWERYFYGGADGMPAAPGPPTPLDATPTPLDETPAPPDAAPAESSTSRDAVPYRLPPCEPSTSSGNAAGRPGPKEPKPPNRPPPPDGPARCGRRAASKSAADDAAGPGTRKNAFLRKSRPSGAPKGWAPKLKQVDRPGEFKQFKAKPLPKFIREQLNSRDGTCFQRPN